MGRDNTKNHSFNPLTSFNIFDGENPLNERAKTLNLKDYILVSMFFTLAKKFVNRKSSTKYGTQFRFQMIPQDGPYAQTKSSVKKQIFHLDFNLNPKCSRVWKVVEPPLWKICSSKWVHLPPIFGVKIPEMLETTTYGKYLPCVFFS